MSHFLFVVEVPPSEAISTAPSYSDAWQEFERESNTILAPVKSAIRLQLNSWLIPVENSLPILVELCAAANGHKLTYSALLIENFTNLSGKKSSGPSVRTV